MLIAFTRMNRATVNGTDQELGSLKDIHFDGDSWIVRYVTIDTGTWLSGREVPLQPTILSTKEWGRNLVTADVNQQLVEASPVQESDRPVSRQMEIELAHHYQWPAHWMGGAVMGAPLPSPRSAVPVATQEKIEHAQGELRTRPKSLATKLMQPMALSAVSRTLSLMTIRG